MDPEFINFLVGQTGTGAIAFFAVYLLNQARKDMQALISQHAATQREDKLLLAKTMDDNSKSDTLLNAKIDMLIGQVNRREEQAHDERVRKAA